MQKNSFLWIGVFFGILLLAGCESKSSKPKTALIDYNQSSWLEKGTATEQTLLDRAKAGDHGAQRELGNDCYHKKKYKEAIKWYEKAITEEGNEEVLHTLGVMYMQGMGTPKNIKKSVEYFKRGAKYGIVMSMYNLGTIYLTHKGEFSHLEEGYKLIKSTAKEGFDEGQYSLAYCYEKGTGTSKNLKKAHEWYAKSAKQGNSKAQYRLGALYLQGHGCKKDLTKAKKWFFKAEKNGMDITALRKRFGWE